MGLLVVLLGLGLYVRLLSEYSRVGAAEGQELVRQVLGLLLVFDVTLTVVFLASAYSLGEATFPSLRFHHFIIVAVLSIVETVVVVYATLYRAQARAWRFVGVMAVQVGVSLAASIGLVAGLGLKDMGMLVGRLVGDIAALVSIAPTVRLYLPKIPARNALPMIRGAFAIVPATFASVLVATSPRYFLEHAGGAAEVGNYAFTSKVAGVISLLFVQPFALAWHPIMFQMRTAPNASRLFGRIVATYLILGCFVALGLTLLAGGLSRHIWSGEYSFSPTLLGLLAFANVAVGLTQAVNIGPYVTNKLSAQLPAYILGVVTLAALSGLFIQRWHVEGAALALLSAQVVLGVSLFMISQRLYRISLGGKWLVLGLLFVFFAYAAGRHIDRAVALTLPSVQPFLAFIVATVIGISACLAWRAFVGVLTGRKRPH